MIAGRGASTDPSAILIVSPRVLYSQVTLAGSGASKANVEDLVLDFDDTTTTQSTISLRVSRGKSQVNLADPSRPYRRVAPKRIHRGDSSPVVVRLQNLTRVKFKSNENERLVADATTEGTCINPGDMILPTSILRQPVEKLKSMYDFYSPGQSAEDIKEKIQRLKARMLTMRQDLTRTRESCIFGSAISIANAGSTIEPQVNVVAEEPPPASITEPSSAEEEPVKPEEEDDEFKSGTSAPTDTVQSNALDGNVIDDAGDGGETDSEFNGPETGTDGNQDAKKN